MKASEIRFRGKRVDNGEIVEGYLVRTDTLYVVTEAVSYHQLCLDKFFEVHPDSIETVQKLYTQEEVSQLLQKQKEICACSIRAANFTLAEIVRIAPSAEVE